jgi:hypothetical protein
MRQTVAFERIASEPEVLDRDMTPADIAAVRPIGNNRH